MGITGRCPEMRRGALRILLGWWWMGAIYVDGKYTPYAVALRMLNNAQGSRQLEISKEVAVRLKAANVAVVAWQSSADSRFASVLLTNVDRYNTTKLPPVSNWFSHATVSGIVGASLLGQREAGQPNCGEIDGLQGSRPRSSW